MKAMPEIQKFMTAMPHTVGADIGLSKAYEIMKEYQIRHLPVQDGGKLVGILSDRDVKLASSFGDVDKLVVEDVMAQDPYTVAPDSKLDEVVLEMAENKYGSAVIQQGNGKVVGIFTAVDGLRTLGEVLHQRFKL